MIRKQPTEKPREEMTDAERLEHWRKSRVPLNTPKGKYDWDMKRGKKDGKQKAEGD